MAQEILSQKQRLIPAPTELLLFRLRRAASAAALHTKPLADTSPGKRWETHAGIKDEVTIIPAS